MKPARPPLSADKSETELGSAFKGTGIFSPKSAEASIFHQALASPLCVWAGSIDQGCAGGVGCCCLCSACTSVQPVTCGGFYPSPKGWFLPQFPVKSPGHHWSVAPDFKLSELPALLSTYL